MEGALAAALCGVEGHEPTMCLLVQRGGVGQVRVARRRGRLLRVADVDPDDVRPRQHVSGGSSAERIEAALDDAPAELAGAGSAALAAGTLLGS
jgi:hypothetical protein